MGRRTNLTCCVRLSPEKEPERFVALVEELARRGSLTRLSVVPMLCGSATGVPSSLPAHLDMTLADGIWEGDQAGHQ